MVGVEDVESMGFGFGVAVGEVDVGDFEALSHDGVDAHGLLVAGLSDADGHLVHLALEVFLLVLLLLLLLTLLLVELGGSLDVGEEAHLVGPNGFGEFNESIVSADGPSPLAELLLIGGEIIEVFSLSLDLFLDDGSNLGGLLNLSEGVSGHMGDESSGQAKPSSWQQSSGNDSRYHLNQDQQTQTVEKYLYTIFTLQALVWLKCRAGHEMGLLQYQLILINYSMIKSTILILTFLVLASSVSYNKFNTDVGKCYEKHMTTCDIDFYNSPSVSDEEIQCAQDFKKAQVCFTTYKQCFPADAEVDSLTAEMPVVCWQCFMNIDSDSMNFKDFQNCIHTSGSNHLVLGLLLLLAFLFMS